MDASASDTAVLIVDDEPFIRKTVKEILSDEGYTVEEAGDSRACLDWLSRKKFDVVLMDIQMPGESGLDTFRRMARDKYQADTVMISGHGTIETAVEAIKIGAHDFLEKPFSSAKLKSVVRSVIEKRDKMKAVDEIKSEGRSLGPYLLGDKIAEGGTAAVYRAHQRNLDRTLAVKVLHAHMTGEPTFTQRFEMEAKTTALLSHPNIVQVFDFGLQDGLHYLAMEYVDGPSLKDFLKEEKRLPLHIAVATGIKVCMALEHAHAHGVVHRDIKPGNILIAKGGAVKLVDFGISRCLASSAAELTQADQIIGTPLYMSPEQIEGGKVGPEADIFALGTLLYLITTLRFPFTGSNMGAILKAITDCAYVPPKSINREISEGLNAAIIQCLQKKLSKRFANVATLREALENSDEMRGRRNVDRVLEDFF